MACHEKGKKILAGVFGGGLSASRPAFTELTEITSCSERIDHDRDWRFVTGHW